MSTVADKKDVELDEVLADEICEKIKALDVKHDKLERKSMMELGKLFYELHAMYHKPGRNGEWTAKFESLDLAITQKTADRYRKVWEAFKGCPRLHDRFTVSAMIALAHGSVGALNAARAAAVDMPGRVMRLKDAQEFLDKFAKLKSQSKSKHKSDTQKPSTSGAQKSGTATTAEKHPDNEQISLKGITKKESYEAPASPSDSLGEGKTIDAPVANTGRSEGYNYLTKDIKPYAWKDSRELGHITVCYTGPKADYREWSEQTALALLADGHSPLTKILKAAIDNQQQG